MFNTKKDEGDKYMMDKSEYENEYLSMIKKAKTDKEMRQAINKIYMDGFQDGHSEGLEDSKSGDF